MAELIKLGKELGYEGQELRDLVSRQQDIQRADRFGPSDRVTEG